MSHPGPGAPITVRLRRRPALLLLALAGLGCSDALAPGDVIGYYALDRVDQGIIPALVNATVNCDTFLKDGTLLLSGVGTFSMTVESLTDCSRSGGLGEDVVYQLAGTWSVVNGQVRLDVTQDPIPLAPRILGVGSGVVSVLVQGDVWLHPALTLAYRRPPPRPVPAPPTPGGGLIRSSPISDVRPIGAGLAAGRCGPAGRVIR